MTAGDAQTVPGRAGWIAAIFREGPAAAYDSVGARRILSLRLPDARWLALRPHPHNSKTTCDFLPTRPVLRFTRLTSYEDRLLRGDSCCRPSPARAGIGRPRCGRGFLNEVSSTCGMSRMFSRDVAVAVKAI